MSDNDDEPPKKTAKPATKGKAKAAAKGTKGKAVAAKKAKRVADSDSDDDELSVDDDAVSSSPCTACNPTCNRTCNPACPARSPVYLACAPAACRRCSAYAL